MENKKKTDPANNTIKTEDNIEVYANKIYQLADEYINTLPDPEMIYKSKTITGMFLYIYNNCICYLLNNKNKSTAHRYNDIKLLDNLFNIYIDLCYKYDNIPTILEFSCIYTGINRDTIQEWKNNSKGSTPEYSVTAKNWYQICELAQVKEKDIKSIFLLKSNFNYNDQLAPVPLEMQGRTTSIEQLPVLNSLHNTELIENSSDTE